MPPRRKAGVELSPDSLTATFAAADLSQDPELAQMVALASAAPEAAGEAPAE